MERNDALDAVDALYKTTHGDKQANHILCMNVCLVKIEVEGSQKGKWDYCGDDILFDPKVRDNKLISKKAKIICIFCAKKKKY